MMKVKKGFTLVELLIGLALFAIIISLGTSLTLTGINTHGKVFAEFDIQSKSRLALQNVNSTVRDSAATFLLHRDDGDRENEASFTEGWNYILLSNDKTKLLQYSWDESESKFIKKELISSLDGVVFDLVFNKITNPNEDKLLEYELKVIVNGSDRVFLSELEGVNSLQIVDRAYGKVANTLAFRYDTKLSEVSNAQAAIAMVLDQSGSMAYRMDGNSSSNDSSTNPNYHSRMKKLKAEATRFINELAKQPNIFISINPFSSTGNNSKQMLKAQVNNTANNDLLTYVNNLNASGGTNTGDGIRRGYYRIVEFNEEEENKNKTNKNFIIILVDGVTTFASINEYNDIISSITDRGSSYNVGGYNYQRSNPSTSTVTTNIDYGDTYMYNDYEHGKYDTNYSEISTQRDRGETYRYNNRDYVFDRRVEAGEINRSNYNGESYTSNNVQYFYNRTVNNRYYYKYYNYYYRYYTYSYRTYLYRFNGVKTIDYVTGNSNIDNREASENNYYSDGRYAGYGNSLDPWGTEYVNLIGQMVRDYKKGTNEAIKAYVIGFSAKSSDHGSLRDIAVATSGEAVFYEAGDEEALREIFLSIQRDISDALWHIGGPN